MTSFRAHLLGAARGVEFVRRAAPMTAAFSVLVLGAGFVGFQQLYSSFATYDDEGYVLLSLRMFLAGRPLYDDVYTQYGPAYYVLQYLLHGLTGLPVTHDVARWKTLFVWLVTAGMSAGYIQRMTRHSWLSAFAFLTVFFHLDRLGLEPGHPQDICLPIIATILLVSTYVRGANTSRWVLGSVGALLGVIATTKLNLGIFCGLATMLALLAVTRRGAMRTTALTFVLAGATALPFVLLKQNAFTWTGARLPGLVCVGILGLVLVLRDNKHAPIAPLFLKSIGGTMGAAALVALLFLSVALFRGTSLAGLYWGMIGQHAGFAADCYAHPPLPPFALLWAVAALVVILRRSHNERMAWWLLSGAAVLLVLLQRRYLGESFHPVVHGLYDRGWASILATVVTPLACVLLMRPIHKNADDKVDSPVDSRNSTEGERRSFSRWFLAWNVVLQPLAIIPVPGTQLAIGTLPALLMLFVLCSDLIKRLQNEGRAFQRVSPNAAFKAVLIIAFITLCCRGWKNWQRRFNYQPLALPGAELLRLPHDEVARIRSTVQNLRERADTFVTLPCGFNSLYLWTELMPPTGLNTTVWDVLLDDNRQQVVIDALERAREPRLVIYTNWPPVIRPNAPLVKYLRETFTQCEVDGTAQIWSRPKS